LASQGGPNKSCQQLRVPFAGVVIDDYDFGYFYVQKSKSSGSIQARPAKFCRFLSLSPVTLIRHHSGRHLLPLSRTGAKMPGRGEQDQRISFHKDYKPVDRRGRGQASLRDQLTRYLGGVGFAERAPRETRARGQAARFEAPKARKNDWSPRPMKRFWILAIKTTEVFPFLPAS